MADKKPGADSNRHTRIGYAIPHVPTAPESDEPTDIEGKHPVAAPLVVDARPGAKPAAPQPVARAAVPASPAPRPQAAHAEPAARSATPAPPIEVEYIRETDLTAARQGPQAMLEIWTRNRIYYVDSQMTCIAVISRATGRAEAEHSLLGAKLTGGQRRSKTSNAVEIVFPYPVPGTEAAFRKDLKRHGQYGHTSTIERVVLKIRKVVVGAVNATEPLWDEITGRFQIK